MTDPTRRDFLLGSAALGALAALPLPCGLAGAAPPPVAESYHTVVFNPIPGAYRAKLVMLNQGGRTERHFAVTLPETMSRTVQIGFRNGAPPVVRSDDGPMLEFEPVSSGQELT